MKVKLLACTLLGAAALAVAAKDPVLMKINGKGVKLSEFEYLFHKNNQQQLQKESLQQYVDRFVTYKLKVADAEAEKIDTLKRIKAELEGYKNELVAPYLVDTTVTAKLVAEAYDRATKNVDIDHLMLPLGKDKADNDKQLAKMDSLRNCILHGQDFSKLAKQYSIDPSVKTNGGHYGYITAGVFPYKFEYEAFNTPVGQMSKPFRTDFGVHMVRVNAVRNDDGQVHAEHILRLFPRNATDSAKAAVKAQIDSIYNVVVNGGNFEDIAKNESQDPGSAKRGGDLGWFGRGRMLKQFEDVAFGLADGQISKPFETSYGYHIVKKLGHKPTASFKEMEPQLKQMIASDERASMPAEAKLKQIKAQYKYAKNPTFSAYIESQLDKCGGYDSTFAAKAISGCNVAIFTYDGITVPASALLPLVNTKAKLNKEGAVSYFGTLVDDLANTDIKNHYIDQVIAGNSDLSNLLNEYRDGTLLYEVSNNKVWEGASRDTTGLNNFFNTHRSAYTWNVKHFKGIILLAKSDSVARLVKADLKKLKGEPLDTITTTLHRKFKRDIKMERMLVGKGENKMVDHLVFKGPKAESKEKAYPVYFVLDGKVLSQPEDVNDVKGRVTSDYQDVLEKRWVANLKAKYPVEIYQDVLKQVK